MEYSISKEEIAPDPKYVEKIARAQINVKQIESFDGLANFYGRRVHDFATKLVPLNNLRNSVFSCCKIEQKAFANIKNEVCANPLVQPYSLQNEATVTTDASEKLLAEFLHKKGNFLYN